MPHFDVSAKIEKQVLARKTFKFVDATSPLRAVFPLVPSHKKFKPSFLKMTVTRTLNTTFTSFDFEIAETDDIATPWTLDGQHVISRGTLILVPNQPIASPVEKRVVFEPDFAGQMVETKGTVDGVLAFFMNVNGGAADTEIDILVELYGEAMG